jgi:predicted HicB family RNase H-like nuclease
MMEYKGYTAKVEFDNDAGLFHGHVLHTRDVITFQGTSVDELRTAFRDSVDDYLDFCASRGELAEKPFSGRFLVRIDPELHRSIAIAASLSGDSLNTWVAQCFRRAVTPEPPIKRMASAWMEGSFASTIYRRELTSRLAIDLGNWTDCSRLQKSNQFGHEGFTLFNQVNAPERDIPTAFSGRECSSVS